MLPGQMCASPVDARRAPPLDEAGASLVQFVPWCAMRHGETRATHSAQLSGILCLYLMI